MKNLFFLIIAWLCITSTSVFCETSPIKIGWIGPLTGPAAVLGVDTIPAIQMAFDEAHKNGKDERIFQLVPEDDQYITARTLDAYNRLVHQQGIKVLIMLTYGGVFALADRAQRDGVLLIDPLDCDESLAKLPSNIICISKPTEPMARVNARGATSRGDVPAGVIYFNSDPFMETLAKESIDQFAQDGHPVAYSEGYTGGTTDFKGMILRAKSKSIRSLFLYGYDETGYAMKQARELGLTVPFYMTNTLTSPGVKEVAGNIVEGAFLSTYRAPRGPRFDSFIAEFHKRTGRGPSFEVSTFPSYDIAHLLTQAYRQEGLKDLGSSEPIQKFFYTVKNYDGLAGIITVDADGATRSLKSDFYQFRDGKVQEPSL